MNVQTVAPADELEAAAGVVSRLFDSVADQATKDALSEIFEALGRTHEAALAWLAIKERTIHGPDVELSTWSDGPTIADSGLTVTTQGEGPGHSWWITAGCNGNGWRHGCTDNWCRQCDPAAFEPSFTGAWLSLKERVERVIQPDGNAAPAVILDR